MIRDRKERALPRFSSRFARSHFFCSATQWFSDGAVAPSRGCGSKPVPDGKGGAVMMVAPSRGCGSKQVQAGLMVTGRKSPPHGGADRNAGMRQGDALIVVAPSRGCGSKPPAQPSGLAAAGVAPSRGCGSKRLAGNVVGQVGRSPPHGGADRNTSALAEVTLACSRPLTGVRIETGTWPRPPTANTVAPSRGCGSKLGAHYHAI